MIKFLKGLINRFLKKLADENQKSFGNKRLDCCDLDRDKNKLD